MKKRLAFALFILAAILPGCEKKPVAVVNGEKISEKILTLKINERIREHRTRGASVDRSALRSGVLEQLISETLLLQGARNANITVPDEEVQRELQSIRQSMGEIAYSKSLKDNELTAEEFAVLLREKLMKEKFAASLVPDDEISEDDLLQYYRHSPKPFLMPETVEVRFIQTRTSEEAEEVMQKLGKGKAGFDKVADRLAEEDTAVVSEYGWTSPDMFTSEIADALRRLKRGSHDGPYMGRTGHYYIFRVKDRRNERPKTFEEAKEEIRSLLYQQKRAAAVIHWVAGKKRSSEIRIN